MGTKRSCIQSSIGINHRNTLRLRLARAVSRIILRQRTLPTKMHINYVPLPWSRNQMNSHSQHHPQVPNRRDMGYTMTAEDQDNNKYFIRFPHMIRTATYNISRNSPKSPPPVRSKVPRSLQMVEIWPTLTP